MELECPGGRFVDGLETVGAFGMVSVGVFEWIAMVLERFGGFFAWQRSSCLHGLKQA